MGKKKKHYEIKTANKFLENRELANWIGLLKTDLSFETVAKYVAVFCGSSVFAVIDNVEHNVIFDMRQWYTENEDGELEVNMLVVENNYPEGFDIEEAADDIEIAVPDEYDSLEIISSSMGKENGSYAVYSDFFKEKVESIVLWLSDEKKTLEKLGLNVV